MFEVLTLIIKTLTFFVFDPPPPPPSWESWYRYDNETHPAGVLGGFITVHQGYIYFGMVSVAKLLENGGSIESVSKYLEAKGNIQDVAIFGVPEGGHVYVPPGTLAIPISVPTQPDEEAKSEPNFSSYVFNTILDKKALDHLNSGVRAECSAFLVKSMGKGLEKMWTQPNNATAVKKYITAWNEVTYTTSVEDVTED